MKKPLEQNKICKWGQEKEPSAGAPHTLMYVVRSPTLLRLHTFSFFQTKYKIRESVTFAHGNGHVYSIRLLVCSLLRTEFIYSRDGDAISPNRLRFRMMNGWNASRVLSGRWFMNILVELKVFYLLLIHLWVSFCFRVVGILGWVNHSVRKMWPFQQTLLFHAGIQKITKTIRAIAVNAGKNFNFYVFFSTCDWIERNSLASTSISCSARQKPDDLLRCNPQLRTATLPHLLHFAHSPCAIHGIHFETL